MDSIAVAQEATKLLATPVTLKFHSRGQDLTLSVPAEFIWYTRSHYPDSPQVKVKIPRLFCGRSISFRDDKLCLSSSKYTWSVDMGSEADEDTPVLTYVEFSVVAGKESIEAKVVRCSEDEKIKVIEYLERFTRKRSLGTFLSGSVEHSTQSSEGMIYNVLTDVHGNTFEVVDNRNIVSNTRNLSELCSLIVENQKPMAVLNVKEIMNSGLINSLLG